MVRNAFLHLTNIVQGTVVWLRFKAQVKHRPLPWEFSLMCLSPYPNPRQRRIYFLSIWIFLFWVYHISSVQFSRSVVSDSLRPHESQHTRPPCLSPTPGVYPNPCPSVSDVIQPSHPLSSPSPPALNLSQHQGLFQGVSSSHQVAKALEFQLQHQSFQ